MKRNFGKKLIVAAALCCLPFSAMALEAMDDSTLGAVTGQAGVSIALDDVVLYMKAADVTYIDTNGFGKASEAGIKLEHSGSKLLTLGAILDGSTYGITEINHAFFQYEDTNGDWQTHEKYTDIVDKIGIFDSAEDAGTALAQEAVNSMATGALTYGSTNGATGNFKNGISPLTIDIGECEALTKGWLYNTNNGETEVNLSGTSSMAIGTAKGNYVAGVVIGLPTVEIKTYYENDSKAVKLTGVKSFDTANKAINNDHEFITIQKSGSSTLAILGGRLEIAPH